MKTPWNLAVALSWVLISLVAERIAMPVGAAEQTTPAAAAAEGESDGLDPGRIQKERRRGLEFLRQVERPSLIERLVRTPEPVELQPREMAFLEAYLAANSRPRRERFDGFYSNRIALRGSSFDDPEDRQVTASRNVSHDEWQRLRTHLLFNRLLAAQPAPHAVR
ncbi:MAG: hypothetical protein U0939_17880 [Pirellulales bacterium]